ncbi:hypothetical protein [Marivita sp.]|uniref:hypothetical protein n=1 Tax=Marivita sp. TaxID=2003365 RepID=UPI003F6D2C15
MTSRFLTAFAGLGLLSACALPPEGVTPVDLAAFDEAVASIGCDLVDEGDYLPVELQTGLTRQQVLETAQFRLASEQAVSLSNGGIRLITGACAPE